MADIPSDAASDLTERHGSAAHRQNDRHDRLLKNPAAPADPSKMPQYRIVQEVRGRPLTAKAHRLFAHPGKAGTTSDDDVRASAATSPCAAPATA